MRTNRDRLDDLLDRAYRIQLSILAGFAVLSGTLAAIFTGQTLVAWAFPIGLGIVLALAAVQEAIDDG